MDGERLLDEEGLPKPYRMVEICKDALEDGEVDAESFQELDAMDGYGLNYRKAVESIEQELLFFLGEEKAGELAGHLRSERFEEAYSLLDESWEDSVDQFFGDDELEDWQPG